MKFDRKMHFLTTILFGSCVMLLNACASTSSKSNTQVVVQTQSNNPYDSTYNPDNNSNIVIQNANLLVGNGDKKLGVDIHIKGGKIAAVGPNLSIDASAHVINVKGKWVTPGLIDVHSHLGVYPAPGVRSSSDGNELTNPVTAEVWAEHSVWPQDPQFRLALAGGVTSMQILPGSGNLIGGRGVTLKNVPARSIMGMKFPAAPHSLKMACGENPKRVYGSKKRAPSTRMGNVAGYRKAWVKALEFKNKRNDNSNKESKNRDIQLETLADVLDGKILVHNHCYRADEMLVMLDLAKEFGYKITAFHHAVEAYKVADVLAKHNVCAAMWADWWGFKQEAYDFVRENIAMVDAAKGCAILHSDSPVGIQHLNHDAAKAMASGNKMGLNISPEHAIRWITLNPAKSLGIDDQTGSVEAGKMADIVIWDGNPFSVYSHANKVYIDGTLMYDRDDESRQPNSDFDIGILSTEGERL